jgi:quercetin dioxygenase-like cupin family protein
MTGESLSHSFLADLSNQVSVPEKGILSRVLCKDEHVNITVFAFSAGEELSAHSVPAPAILYFLEGEAEVRLEEERFAAHAGSFAYMPPLLPHAVSAKSPAKMLLIQVKRAS